MYNKFLLTHFFFLRLCGMQNALQLLTFVVFACNAKRFAIVFLFYLFLFLLGDFGRTSKSHFKFSSNCCFQCVWSGPELIIWYVMCFKRYRNKQKWRLKWKHLEFCTSSTKNNISPLQQCLWPPNLAGWRLAKRCSHQ